MTLLRQALSRRWLAHARCRAASTASTASRTANKPDVRIVEVGPRDGLQNEKAQIALATKLQLIYRLVDTGVQTLEAGSFVSPKWVPQMANAEEIMNSLLGHPTPTKGVSYNFLVPTAKGLDRFFSVLDNPTSIWHGSPSSDISAHSPTESPSSDRPKTEWPASNTSSQDPNEMPSTKATVIDGVDGTERTPSSVEWPAPNTSSQDPNAMPSKNATDQNRSTPVTANESSKASGLEISVFAAATESFSRANINCSIEESLERFREIITKAKTRDIRVRGYVSVALGCPYEGHDVDPIKVAEVVSSLLEMGVDEVSVADTTGMGTAPRTAKLMKALSAAGIASQDLALHFHDTYGQALVNTMVGLEHGVRTFDSAVGGLGGCPFSKGATGNVATEDLVYCLHSLGVQTGIDNQKMAETGAWISRELGRAYDSRAGRAILAHSKSQ